MLNDGGLLNDEVYEYVGDTYTDSKGIDFPAQNEAIEVSAMQELYDALRAGASPTVSATGP